MLEVRRREAGPKGSWARHQNYQQQVLGRPEFEHMVDGTVRQEGLVLLVELSQKRECRPNGLN